MPLNQYFHIVLPLRKREVSARTRELLHNRKANFRKMNTDERKAASKAIANLSREDYRAYVDGILQDMAATERIGSMREITRFRKVLTSKSNSDTIMPSKDLAGKTITSQNQLLATWNECLSKMFTSPDADKDSKRETTVSAEEHLLDDELEDALKALNSSKATGWDKIS